MSNNRFPKQGDFFGVKYQNDRSWQNDIFLCLAEDEYRVVGKFMNRKSSFHTTELMIFHRKDMWNLEMAPMGFTIHEGKKVYNVHGIEFETVSGSILNVLGIPTGDLTENKTKDIINRGFVKVGYVLQNPHTGEYCISAQSAVRWLDQPQYWRLMHEQDGSLFTPKVVA